MNKDVLLRAADSIEKESEVKFSIKQYKGNRDANGNSCRTSACVAGFIVFNEDPNYFKNYYPSLFGGIGLHARKLAGLDEYQSDSLFLGAGVSFETINKNKKKVPDAIRWMVANENFDWREAFEAVGVRIKY